MKQVLTLHQWKIDILLVPDTKFLLAFLRARKFSQLESRKLLENFLRRRTKLSAWSQDLDPANPKIQAAWDTGWENEVVWVRIAVSMQKMVLEGF